MGLFDRLRARVATAVARAVAAVREPPAPTPPPKPSTGASSQDKGPTRPAASPSKERSGPGAPPRPERARPPSPALLAASEAKLRAALERELQRELAAEERRTARALEEEERALEERERALEEEERALEERERALEEERDQAREREPELEEERDQAREREPELEEERKPELEEEEPDQAPNVGAWGLLEAAASGLGRVDAAVENQASQRAIDGLSEVEHLLQLADASLDQLPDEEASERLFELASQLEELREVVADDLSGQAQADRVAAMSYDPDKFALVQLNGGVYVTDSSGDKFLAAQNLWDDSRQPGLNKMTAADALIAVASFTDAAGLIHTIRVPIGAIKDGPEAIEAWLSWIEEQFNWEYSMLELDGYEAY